MDNARAQLDNEAQRNAALQLHDQNWLRERDKLSNSSLPYPNFDLGSREHRNLHHEYQERRTSWEYGLRDIENKHDDVNMNIREEGQTLSHEFAEQNYSNGMDITQNSIAEANYAQLNKGELKQDFAVRASGKSVDQDFSVSNDTQSLSKTL